LITYLAVPAWCEPHKLHILGCASSVRAAQAFILRSSFAQPSLKVRSKDSLIDWEKQIIFTNFFSECNFLSNGIFLVNRLIIKVF